MYLSLICHKSQSLNQTLFRMFVFFKQLVDTVAYMCMSCELISSTPYYVMSAVATVVTAFVYVVQSWFEPNVNLCPVAPIPTMAVIAQGIDGQQYQLVPVLLCNDLCPLLCFVYLYVVPYVW